MSKDPNVQLGTDTWLTIYEQFLQAVETRGITTHEQYVALWAGFLASSCGAMCANIGADFTAALLDEVKKSVSAVSRRKLKAVKS